MMMILLLFLQKQNFHSHGPRTSEERVVQGFQSIFFAERHGKDFSGSWLFNVRQRVQDV
jgi:hypothetical protein